MLSISSMICSDNTDRIFTRENGNLGLKGIKLITWRRIVNTEPDLSKFHYNNLGINTWVIDMLIKSIEQCSFTCPNPYFRILLHVCEIFVKQTLYTCGVMNNFSLIAQMKTCAWIQVLCVHLNFKILIYQTIIYFCLTMIKK